MKILFLNTDLNYGGAEKMMAWLANQCANHNFDVTFLTYREYRVEQKLSNNINFVHKQLENSSDNKIKSLKTIYWIHKFIKKNNFDVGIAFLSPSILRLALASKGTNIKLLFSHRADPYYKSINNSIISQIDQWAFASANGFVFQTENAKKFFNLKIQKKSTVIPNPIFSLKRTKERKNNIQKIIVNVARLDLKQKRQDLLIQAFNIISPKFPEYTLELYGDGKDLNLIIELAKSNPKIHIKGKTNNVSESIQNASMFVLTSDFEGIPNALLESMSLGIPSISTDCSPGGAALLIQNNYNGILTEKGNAEKIAKAMEYYILNPDKAELFGQNAMEVNQIYSEEKIAKLWISTLLKLKN